MRGLTRFNRNQPGFPADDFSKIVDEFFGTSPSRSVWGAGYEAPKAEIHEDEKNYSVSLDIPGMKEEDIKINFSQGVLTVAGERKYEREAKEGTGRRSEKFYGHFERAFRFMDDIDPKTIEASYRDGVLEVTLPKSQQHQAQTIPVNKKLNQVQPEKH